MAAQKCTSCQREVVLRAGAVLDQSVVPVPLDPTAPKIVVRSAGLVLLKQGVVSFEGVTHGHLDPVTGFIPLDQAGVRYSEILSVAVWRNLDWVRLVIALLFIAPLTLITVVGSFSIHGLVVLALPFVAFQSYLVYKIVIVRRHWVRVVGTYRTLTIQFDTPLRRRRKFIDELFRRAGLGPRPSVVV